MAKKTQDDITRGILDKIRTIQEASATSKHMLNESEERATSDAIAITDDPKFGQNVLTNQIQQFRSAVESGAQFTKPEECDVAECPLIYMPSTGNLIFSGIIPCLNNLRWQFVLKTTTGNGCFVWNGSDDKNALILNKDNIQILSKLWGFYRNWVEQWNIESADLEKMANHWKETL